MKRYMTVLMLVLVLVLPGAAFAGFPSDDIPVMTSEQIENLTDGKLMDTYVDILAELEAARSYHTTSEYTPKEYKKFKELVKYRMLLVFEIHRRKVDLPPELD